MVYQIGRNCSKMCTMFSNLDLFSYLKYVVIRYKYMRYVRYKEGKGFIMVIFFFPCTSKCAKMYTVQN